MLILNTCLFLPKHMSSKTLKGILKRFEAAIVLNVTAEALFERAKLLALADDFDRALEDLRRAEKMSSSPKIRLDRTRHRFCPPS